MSEGDDQLRRHAEALNTHFMSAVGENPPQDPQLVADKIFECATEATPVHNPVGMDAEGIMQVMDGAENRQAFIDAMAARLLPS